MERHIDLKKLSLDELAGVINLYPWFGSARKELCQRMLELGGEGWGKEQFADAAMYVPSGKIMAGMLRSSVKEDCADKDISSVIRHYVTPASGSPVSREDTPEPLRQVRVVGGDYFSQQEYDRVRTDSDRVFGRFSFRSGRTEQPEEDPRQGDMDFCTETLAQIYAEQGYYEHAIRIYEKLILAYPEKNAYFAALIEKLKTED